MTKTHYVAHDSRVVVLPRPSSIVAYLRLSELWRRYFRPFFGTVEIGFVCVRPCDEGRPILIFDDQFERFEHDPFYDERLFGVLSLMAAVEGEEPEVLIQRIKAMFDAEGTP
jgi:hypothetical protein